VPFTISWSAVSDPSGIVAYNWQVSSSSSFASVVEQNSTNGQLQDTVSGLPNGTYFWRVQAVNGNFVQGAWSGAQSFTVTGANAGEPGSPTLNPAHGATAFHPMEVIYFDWSAVPGAATYILDASTDPTFPIATRVHFDNIPNTNYSLQMGDSMPQGTWYVRVSAVNANRIAGVPSNVVTFTLSFNAPLPPPPTPLTPANGATVTLPVTLTWTDVPNPQPSGYVVEIARDPGFQDIEDSYNQITGPSWTRLSLTAGTKYWHVLSTQGDSAPGVPANTAWSATRSFVVPSTPPGMGSLAVTRDPAANGQTQTVWIQLTGPAPAGGAVVHLTSSDPAAAPVPATWTVPSGVAFDGFGFQVGSVNVPTQVTLTATINGTSASVSFMIQPVGLQSLTISPSTITGGVAPTLIVMLNGQAPAGGTVVSLSSSDPALANVPATATVPAGSFSISLNIPTGAVTTNTPVTISASLNGTTLQTHLTLTPQQAPDSLTLSPTSTSGTAGSNGTVRLAAPANADTYFLLASSNPAVASVPPSVQVPRFAAAGGFLISTTPVTTTTTVTISVTGAGVTRTATLTLLPSGVPTPTATPPPAATPTLTPTPGAGPTLSALTLNPTTVRGRDSSTGRVTLTAPAPAGGAVVALASSNTSFATVPSSVTIPAGATSATFTVRTQRPQSTIMVVISGSYAGTSRSATLTITR
jgi:hypothetical protein